MNFMNDQTGVEPESKRLRKELAQARHAIRTLWKIVYARRFSRGRRFVRLLLPGTLRTLWDEWNFRRFEKIIERSGKFDRTWYLSTYPDVAQSGVDPVKHYVRWGAVDGRKPRADFDPVNYLCQYPDLGLLNLDPFVHYSIHSSNSDLNRALDPSSGSTVLERPALAEPSDDTQLVAEKYLNDAISEINTRLAQSNLRVSVIIPCFNYGRFVGEAVTSALEQVYPHVDVIIVNDGSTDDSGEICDRLADNPRVRVLHQTNQGLSAARNTGARASNSEFLLFLDADDLLEPSAITLMLWSLLNNPGAAYVYSSQRFFGDQQLVWEPQEFNGFDLLWSNHPSVCSLIRREAFDRVGGYSSGMVVGYEDWNHWIMLLRTGLYGMRLRAPLFKHRRHGVTMTHEAHARHRLLHHKIRAHSPEVYDNKKITQLKAEWRPAVSIIIPFYNGHKYLRETLDSVYAQTIRDYEIIIVNDGSDDADAQKLLHELRAESGNSDVPLRIINCEHRGAPATRNAGAQAAKSEFIFFLDADDLLSPTALEKLILAAAANPTVSYFYSSVRHFGAINGIASDPFDPERLKRENFLTVSCLIRTAVYLDVGGMDEALLDNYEDYDFWLRMLSMGHIGMHVAEVLFHYRRHNHGYRAALEKSSSPEAMYERLRARHPVLFDGPEPDRSNWRLVTSSPVDTERKQIEDLFRKVQPATLLHDSYRRPCLPNMFDPAKWTKRAPRILYLVPFFVYGGAEQVDLEVLRGFRDAGFEVTLVACEDADHTWQSRFEEIVSDAFVLQNLASDKTTRNSIIDYLMLSRSIDLVFIRNTSYGYNLCERWKQISETVAFVDLLHLHASGEDWVRHSAVYHDLLAHRFVITNDLKFYAEKTYHLSDEKFEVIYNGIDTAEFVPVEEFSKKSAEIRAALGLRMDAPVVAYCGRVASQKDPLRWVRVVSKVLQKRPDIQPVVIGDGDLLKDMQSEAARLGISDKFHFLGYRADIKQILPALDVLLMTSRYEGLPQVILEALASGVPIVSTDVGGIRECVDEKIGKLLDVDADDSDIAEAVLQLIDRSQEDPALWEACRHTVEKRFHVDQQRAAYSRSVKAVVDSITTERRQVDYLDRVMARPILS